MNRKKLNHLRAKVPNLLRRVRFAIQHGGPILARIEAADLARLGFRILKAERR